MKILLFGFYDPEYSRNRVLIKGLKQNGIEITECNDNSRGPVRFLKLFFKYWKFIGKFDVMMTAFPGQEVMFLARFLTLRLFSGQARKPIIFDAFTSHYGGYILDRKKYYEKSFKAGYFKLLDKWSCKFADLVFLDTEAHIDFFVSEFGLSRDKFRRIFVGADSDIFYPRSISEKSNRFLVHFHGNYIPLQGVRYIIEAAKILEKENITFNLIGRGQTFEADKRIAEEIGATNINFIDPLPYDELPSYIAKADVCLGIFGNSPKTELVIPNKVYEALAMGKPLITADTPAIQELLSDGVNVFLCRKADPESLAEKILLVKNQPSVAEKMAENGRKVFEEKLKEKVLGTELLQNIYETITLRK